MRTATETIAAPAATANTDADRLQLREITRKVRNALLPLGTRRASSFTATATGVQDHRDVDAGYAEFARLREPAATLCGALCERGGGGVREVEMASRRGKTRFGHGRTSSAASAVSSLPLSLSAVKSRRSHAAADGDGGGEGYVSGAPLPEAAAVAGGTKQTRPASVAAFAHLDMSAGGANGEAADAVPPNPVGDAALEAVQEWMACLEELAAAHKTRLEETYKQFEHFATPEILDALFAERKSRSQIVNGWMKNFGAYRRMESGVRSKWETQFRNYERITYEVGKVNGLIQSVESGVRPQRTIQECVISLRGDTVLEFSNTAMHWKPVLRFLVSSHMLAETSPIFARMFSPRLDAGGQKHPSAADDDLADELPPPPTPFTCQDGSRVMLYKMPQLELNEASALKILLHAAHMHNDRVPREITFERFVALAEAAYRYRCTSPLEMFVEHCWLPQWVHKATEDMPDGLVMISYVFGMRRLFTRVTKTAILNLVDEKELASKPWPDQIKERVWAVRCAKMAQVSSTCTKAIEEFLRQPKPPGDEEDGDKDGDGAELTPAVTTPGSIAASYAPSLNLNLFAHTSTDGPRTFTSVPRCPKGSHWCDATNLGWLMLIYNEMRLLGSVLNPGILSQPELASQARPPPRSLAEILGALRGVTSPPNPVHPGRASVCDPAPAFRSSINDVYNSVSGLTLFDVDGRSHGWALSNHRRNDREPTWRIGGLDNIDVGQTGDDIGVAVSNAAVYGSDGDVPGESGAAQPQMSAAEEVFGDEDLCLEILSALDNFGDLHAVAMVNKGVHEVYKTYELHLMRNIIRTSRPKSMTFPDGWDQSLSPTLENKVLKFIVGRGNADKSYGKYPSPPITRNQGSGRSEETESRVEDSTTRSSGQVLASDGDDATTVSSQIVTPATQYSTLVGTNDDDDEDEDSAPQISILTMTEEEARRIIWPPEPPQVLSPQLSTPDIPTFQPDEIAGLDYGKYEANTLVRVEDKTLVVMGKKQLRKDFDRRVGLIS